MLVCIKSEMLISPCSLWDDYDNRYGEIVVPYTTALVSMVYSIFYRVSHQV